MAQSTLITQLITPTSKSMTKECIICGEPVTVTGELEIVTCENEHCIRIVEDNIGLHYESGN